MRRQLARERSIPPAAVRASDTPQTDVQEPRSVGRGWLRRWPVRRALRLGNEYQLPHLRPQPFGLLLQLARP